LLTGVDDDDDDNSSEDNCGFETDFDGGCSSGSDGGDTEGGYAGSDQRATGRQTLEGQQALIFFIQKINNCSYDRSSDNV
jgi:hypothetical protein